MAIVQVKCKNLKNNPHCPHGPTIKFVRVQAGQRQEFYACSTCRDRKDCSFYLVEGDKLSERMKELWALETQRLLPTFDHKAAQRRLEDVKREPARDRLYCHTCAELDMSVNRADHQGHQVQSVITDVMLSHPSQILKAKEGSKKEAQYFFTESSTQVIVDNLKRAKVGRVICLGTPRVHEMIQASDTSQMDSILLDLDHRYHSFWPQEKFVWYNMFNRHTMAGADVGKRELARFLAAAGEKRVALVLDPPFGGHVEPLAATVEYFTRALAKRHPESELAVIWVFPYFRERHILEKCPSLKMVDYKVQYGNHKDFQNGVKGRKLGSPVRLFTNLVLKSFVLPKSEGYRLCNPCARWVYAENKHCAKCRACTSKDGRKYVHCDACGVCVKPQWQHCVKCSKCLPVGHLCDSKGLKRSNKENLLEPRRKKMKTTNFKVKSSDSKKAMEKNNCKSKGKKVIKKPKSRLKKLAGTRQV